MSVLELSAPTSLKDWTSIHGMTQREASDIVGGLSSPGKMPCRSYGLPAAECNVGSALRESSTSENPTVCGSCYAYERGMYAFMQTQIAQYWRLHCLSDPRWIDAMVCLIGWQERFSRVFRWHDSGDLQSVFHLCQIVEVAERLPWVSFWIPTREASVLRVFLREFGAFPVNLNVRQSCALVGHFPDPARACDGRTFSAVSLPGQSLPSAAWACPAYSQGGECRDCRACWDLGTPVVIYPLH